MSKWKRRTQAGRLEAAAETERWLDRERRSAVQAASRERERQLLGQEDAVQTLEALLFRHDPIGLNYEDNLDEYRAEAQTITLRRSEARSVDDGRRIAHEEFVRWFDVDIAGPPQRYQSIAEEIWADWSTSDSLNRTLDD